MVIDSSAILAILLKEPEALRLITAIIHDSKKLICPISLLECDIVIRTRTGENGVRDLDLFFYESGLEIVALDREQLQIAKQAHAKFGKGRHKAGLNMGDCCSYALAMSLGEKLLFKGDDFSQTDIQRVLY